MKIEVLLEEIGDRRFRAWTARPVELSVEADTADESVTNLKRLLDDWLSRVRVIEIEVGEQAEHPLSAIIGSWRDNPEVDNVIENMRAYRQQVDADPERL